MSVTRLLAHSRHGGGGGGGGGGGRASGPPTPTGSSSTRTVSGSGSSGSIGSNEARATAAAHLSHRWMDGSEWLAYVDWIDKWCHDLIIRSILFSYALLPCLCYAYFQRYSTGCMQTLLGWEEHPRPGSPR